MNEDEQSGMTFEQALAMKTDIEADPRFFATSIRHYGTSPKDEFGWAINVAFHDIDDSGKPYGGWHWSRNYVRGEHSWEREKAYLLDMAVRYRARYPRTGHYKTEREARKVEKIQD